MKTTATEASPETGAHDPVLRLTRTHWIGVLAVCVLLGLVESGKAFLGSRLRDAPVTWGNALIGNMPWWLVWALLAPFAFALARRFRADRGRPSAIAVHFLVAFPISFVHLLAVGALYYRTHAMGRAPSFEVMIRNWIDSFIMLDALTYWALIGSYYALEYYSRFRVSERHAASLAVRAAQLEASMTEARLAALRMELNPHFLFNTLNAISGLIRRRELDGAIGMLARLGELLRVTLEREAAHQVPLERELSFLRLYLDIERVRFHDRLTVAFDIDPEALDAVVPSLVLQPLVENAVRHGIARRPGPGRIDIRARREGDALVVRVQDTGFGFARKESPRWQEGVGLSNTRARLEQQYGGRAQMTLENAAEGGAVVSLTLPFVQHETPVEVVA
jgi:sensor histidine kinase YesM